MQTGGGGSVFGVHDLKFHRAEIKLMHASTNLEKYTRLIQEEGCVFKPALSPLERVCTPQTERLCGVSVPSMCLLQLFQFPPVVQRHAGRVNWRTENAHVGVSLLVCARTLIDVRLVQLILINI